MNDKYWYAVYTKPRWEKKVAELLSKKDIENFCPLNRIQKHWADRKKIVFEPLFVSYVFVRISESEQALLKKTDGIVNLVYWLGKPAVIKDAEIESIRTFLHGYNNVRLEKTSVNINAIVRVISGPLIDHSGQVTEITNKTVRLLLPSLGYMMCAEVQSNNVELLEQNPIYKSVITSQYVVNQ